MKCETCNNWKRQQIANRYATAGQRDETDIVETFVNRIAEKRALSMLGKPDHFTWSKWENKLWNVQEDEAEQGISFRELPDMIQNLKAEAMRMLSSISNKKGISLTQLVIDLDIIEDINRIGFNPVKPESKQEHDKKKKERKAGRSPLDTSKRMPLGMEPTEATSFKKSWRILLGYSIEEWKDLTWKEKRNLRIEYINKSRASAFWRDHEKDETYSVKHEFKRTFKRYWNPKTNTYWMQNPQGIIGEVIDRIAFTD